MKKILKAIGHPHLGGNQPFTLIRKGTTPFGEKRVEQIPAVGNFQPAGAEQLEQLAEKDKKNQVLSLKTSKRLQTGANNSGGTLEKDRVIYRGGVYNVVSAEDWGAFGFCSALIHWIGQVKEGKEGIGG